MEFFFLKTDLDWSSYFCLTAAEQAPSVRIEPRYQTVDEGTTARFTCIVTGTPTPTIEWYRGSGEINPEATITSDGVFTIPRVSPSDESDYYCKATNDAGTTEVRTILYVKRGKTILLTFCLNPAKKGLPLYQMTNCRLFQTDRVCRRQFQI